MTISPYQNLYVLKVGATLRILSFVVPTLLAFSYFSVFVTLHNSQIVDDGVFGAEASAFSGCLPSVKRHHCEQQVGCSCFWFRIGCCCFWFRIVLCFVLSFVNSCLSLCSSVATSTNPFFLPSLLFFLVVGYCASVSRCCSPPYSSVPRADGSSVAPSPLSGAELGHSALVSSSVPPR